MTSYVLQRTALLAPVLLGVATLVFLLVHLTPGGPARAILGEKATPEAVARLNEENGWDRPLWEQYGRFLGDYFLRFDPGRSYLRGEKVSVELRRHLPATAELALAAILLATLLGVAAGAVSAVRKHSVFDYAAMTGSLLGISIPVFFLGLLLILLFGSVLPTGGRLHVAFDLERVTGFHLVDALIAGRPAVFADALRHLLLPALALSTIPMALIARMTRASMLEVLHCDYVRTARAKGLPEIRVVLRHGLRNALVPIVTAVGLQFGYLLAGAVLTETLFQWPGLGRYVVSAVHDRDYNAVQGGILLIAAAFVAVNLLVDLAYAFLDPRIRYGRAA